MKNWQVWKEFHIIGNEKAPLILSRASEFVAVREGFEPSIRYRIHTFQACSFGHSDTSPHC